uniref:Uncharacterized protein n=1 Tax=Polytomella parva TaxID=51329 RepID=A0A6U0WEY4_9CHLO
MQSSAILRQIKRQVFAYKVTDLFNSSPIVAVFQNIGKNDSRFLEENITKKVKELLPESDYVAVTLPCRNSLTKLSSDLKFSDYMSGQNILVGFKSSSAVSERPKDSRIKFSDNIKPILEALNAGVLNGRPRISNKNLAGLMTVALSTPKTEKSLLPIALLYNGSPLSSKDAEIWSKLDEREVFFELLSVIEGPATSIVNDVHEASIGGLADVLSVLSEVNEGIASAADFKAEATA